MLGLHLWTHHQNTPVVLVNTPGCHPCLRIKSVIYVELEYFPCVIARIEQMHIWSSSIQPVPGETQWTITHRHEACVGLQWCPALLLKPAIRNSLLCPEPPAGAATVVSDLQCVWGPTCNAAEPVGVMKRISHLFQSTSPIRTSINWLMSAARVNGFGAECKLVEEEEA